MKISDKSEVLNNKLKRQNGFIFRQKNGPLPQEGFTLIEILVVTVILGLMIAVASNVFVTLLRNQNKTNVLSEVRSNAALVVDTFERDVRSASKIETVCSSGCTYSDYTSPPAPAPPIGVVTSSMTGNFGLVLTYRDGATRVFWQCLTEDHYGAAENGRFIRGTSSDPAIPLTNTDADSGVSIVGCNFVSDDPSSPDSARLVTLNLVAREGANAHARFGTNIELSQPETTFQTTVGIRAF